MHDNYCMKELPCIYRQLGYRTIGYFLDGKDGLACTLRINSALRRSMRSSKMKASAWRMIMQTTPSGLTFEHTRSMGNRID